jgi:lysophospholipase L1-like esterase
MGLSVVAVLLVAVRMVPARDPAPGTASAPTPLPAQPGCSAAPATNSLCILILGDSIAEGVPLVGNERWWPRLQALLATSLPTRSVEIDSWAVSGSQVDVLESAARDQPEVGTYDVAIVIEGVNDEHVIAAPIWQPRYEAAIAMLEAKGLRVIVTAPPPSYENGAFGTRYDLVAAAVREVATRGRPLLDIAARWRADGAAVAGAYYVDTIHQAGPGQILMSTMARDVVLEVLKQRPSTSSR